MPNTRKQQSEISIAHYQRILRTLLHSIRLGISREQLLNDLMNALEQRKVACYLILVEGIREPEDPGRLAEVQIRRIVGCQESEERLGRCTNFRRAFETHWQSSELLRDVLLQHESLDFAFTGYDFCYDGEFLELHGEQDVWLCAVPLPAERRFLPERALFALYPNAGSEEQPKLPPGAKQEWSLLEELPIVYSILEHQLTRLAEMVAEQRDRLIMELAPRFINHEFGTTLGLMAEDIMALTPHLRKVAEKLGDHDPDLIALLQGLLKLRDKVARSRNLVEAFNNIEKRNPGDRARIGDIIGEACDLLEPMFRRQGIQVDRSRVEDFEIHTDSALVQHVVLNVLMNAIEAFAEEKDEKKEDAQLRRHIWIRAHKEGDEAEIQIANDGPPIPVHLGASIFEKGVTTRLHRQGHGQGLYISRLIAQYIGGNFGFCPPERNALPGNVCFRLRFPIRLEDVWDLQAALEK